MTATYCIDIRDASTGEAVCEVTRMSVDATGEADWLVCALFFAPSRKDAVKRAVADVRALRKAGWFDMSTRPTLVA